MKKFIAVTVIALLGFSALPAASVASSYYSGSSSLNSIGTDSSGSDNGFGKGTNTDEMTTGWWIFIIACPVAILLCIGLALYRDSLRNRRGTS